ncbi:prenyltransferase [Actinomycetes bacterium KLBMP 9759]
MTETASADVVDDLLSRLARPGRVGMSGSVYETGRVLALLPGAPGNARRWSWMLDRQGPDGSWGGPGPYRLVPTLSALEAILAAQHLADRHRPSGVPDAIRPRAAVAASRALAFLIADPVDTLPDTVAAELVAAHLADRIDVFLAAGPPDPSWRTPLPRHVDPALHRHVERRVLAAGRVPEKVEHSLEALGPACARLLNRPAHMLVGSSPAASAAWLRANGPDDAVGGQLADLLARCPDGVPCADPITAFELAWIWSTLLDTGCRPAPPGRLARIVAAVVDEDGVRGAPGLPPDADDTAVALYVLTRLGGTPDLAPLLRFEASDRFECYPGEATPSSSTNAHALDALGAHLLRRPGADARVRRAHAKAATWLCDTQSDAGTWADKWHASPVYAVYCAARALHRYGPPAARSAVRRSCRWLLETQHPDGSWGVFGGTQEETAYALVTLAQCGTDPLVADPLVADRYVADQFVADRFVADAIARGRAYLDAAEGMPHPPLWHDKDLFTPPAIVEAACFAARRREGR